MSRHLSSPPRLLRALLTLFPKEFRLAHRRSMEQDFRDQERDAAQAAGRPGVWRLWAATILGTLTAAPTEHGRIFAGDAAYALRRFRRNPGMTAVAVLTIALGIGATTAVFSLVNQVLLRPLPFPEPERLVHIRPLLDGEESMSGPEVSDLLAETAGVFEGVLTMAGLGSTTISGGEAPERVRRLVVSPSYFDVLGVTPLHGRGFRAEDQQFLTAEVLRNAAPEALPIGPVVISHDLWQRRFMGHHDTLGQLLQIDGRSYEIIGILPADFRVLAPRLMNLDVKRDLWYLSNWDPASFPRQVRYLEVLARLAPGVAPEQAQAALDAFAARQRKRHEASAELGFQLRVEPLHKQVVAGTEQPLWLLLGAVILVLLIACANVASIMLAGGATRQGELGMRIALGASRERLVRQLMTESTLIAAAGAALGLVLAWLGLDVLKAFRPDSLQRFETAAIDRSMLLFALAATIFSTLLFGIVPSLRYSRPNLEHALAAGRRSLGGLLRRRGRSLLVAGEIALCFVLIAGTGLLVRTLLAQLRTDPGFAPTGVTITSIHIPRGYPEREERIRLYRRLTDTLSAVPGMRAVGLTSGIPFDASGGHTPITTDQDPDHELLIWDTRVAPGYFRTLGIPLRAGRYPTWQDLADPDQPFALVDEALAARLWPGKQAVGRQVRVSRLDFQGDSDQVPNRWFWAEVIGVVGSVRDDSFIADGPETLYLGLNFTPSTTPILTYRAEGDPAAVERAVRNALLQIDDQIATSPFRGMEDWIGDATASQRFTMSLLALFGLIGLVLAAVGLYALLAYSVRRGSGEIGLRIALGAARGGVLRVVLAQGLKLTLFGLAVGLLGALALGRLLASQLFGVSAADPLTLGCVTALLAFTALLACLLPARRALRVDPIVALREE